MNVGEEIKRRRLERGWSAETLAAEAGIHRNSVYRYEAGGRMDLQVFLQLCAVLGLDVGAMVSRMLPMPPSAPDSEASHPQHSQ